MWTVIAPPQTGWPANNRNVFPIVLKAWDSSIKVSADYVSAEAPLLGWCLPFHCVLTWWKGIHVQALWGHFYKGISPFLRAPPSYPNHLPKGLPPNTITLRLSFEQMNLVSEWVSEWVIECVCEGVRWVSEWGGGGSGLPLSVLSFHLDLWGRHESLLEGFFFF